MSDSELERFSSDLKADAALREAFAQKGNDLGAIVEAAQASGYGFTLEDVQGRLAERGPELSEEELDSVSGGRRSSFTIFVGEVRGTAGVIVHW
jgi:predicted ribosomally synthesized peptide with nif11-like leader